MRGIQILTLFKEFMKFVLSNRLLFELPASSTYTIGLAWDKSSAAWGKTFPVSYGHSFIYLSNKNGKLVEVKRPE